MSRVVSDTYQSQAYGRQKKPDVSVLMPTYNRSDSLIKTLQALERQSADLHQFEVVVIDDGSTDATRLRQEACSQSTPLALLYVRLAENGGPARARNEGLARCRGRVVIIIGDDIEPAESFVAKHQAFHRLYPGIEWALLGHVCFPEELRGNAFMHWLETDGRKYFFDYAALKNGEEAGPLFFSTCNVSVKMELLQQSGWFDESFPHASHEDLELGYRLADKGMHLVYDSSVLGVHWHNLTTAGIARRIYLMGYSADIFWHKVGEQGSLARRIARNVLARTCSLPPMVWLWNRLRAKGYDRDTSYPFQWQILLLLGFFIGLADSKQKKKIRI